jgi:hypothetical protein
MTLAKRKPDFQMTTKTSVSIEPFLDCDPSKVVHVVSPYVTESTLIGPINYTPKNGVSNEDRQRYAEIRKRYEITHLQEIFEGLKEFPKVRFKDSMLIRFGGI